MTLNRDLKIWLNEQPSSEYSFLEKTSLEKYSTLRLSAYGDLLKIFDVAFLKKLYKFFPADRFIIIGRGANSIFPIESDKVYIKLSLSDTKNELIKFKEHYRLSASTGLSDLVSHAMEHGVLGWECLTGIPGTLGGAVFMNAGTSLGEISSIITALEILKTDGEIKKITVTEADFEYRSNLVVNSGEVILYVHLKSLGRDIEITELIRSYLDKRKQSQPLQDRTCGSVFKNDSKYLAGKSLELVGLKNLCLAGLTVSQKHANFISNQGGSNQSDFVSLTNALKQELELTYGIKFELEARFL